MRQVSTCLGALRRLSSLGLNPLNAETILAKPILPLLLIGFIASLTIESSLGVSLHRTFWKNRNIWWTPLNLSLSLEEKRDYFQLYISGKLLQNHIKEETLYTLDKAGSLKWVAPKAICTRFNNRPR